MTLREKLIPKFLQKYVTYYRDHGFKKTIKKIWMEIICNNFYVLFGEGYNSLYYNSLLCYERYF